MTKRWMCALAVLLLLLCPALAEAQDYWTRNADLYYHINENCGGTQGLVPISEVAALAFAKHACPVCLPFEDGGEDVQAAARGGIIVVRFSDEWLEGHELTDVFGWNSDSVYAGEKGWRMLGEYLHGDAYNAFVTDYLSEGNAEGRANTPYILSADGALVMNRRHIGSDWYIIVRPQQKFGSSWSMYWRVSSLGLRMENETLDVRFDRQTVEEMRELKLEKPDGSEAVYSRSADGMDIFVYEVLGGNIAVLREADGNAERLENVQLCIAGETVIELSGCMEGEAAVYCCMLTDGELDALRSNARAELRHIEQLTSQIYRVDEGGYYSYHSDADGGASFIIEKENGSDPADASFRLVTGGVPRRFTARRDGIPLIYDYTGASCAAADNGKQAAERITPLVWYGEKGIFLAEYHKYTDYGPEDRLFADGIEYGVRIGSMPEDEWASYLCWLVDENGEAISGFDNQAFTVLESGEIQMENLEGEVAVYGPFDGD